MCFSVFDMGCGSSQEAVAPQQNAPVRNGDVKRESPPPRIEQQSHPKAEEVKEEKKKRKDSAKSNSSSSSSSSSRSSSAKSKKDRPETAPGGDAPPTSNEPVAVLAADVDTQKPEKKGSVESVKAIKNTETAVEETKKEEVTTTTENTTTENTTKVEENAQSVTVTRVEETSVNTTVVHTTTTVVETTETTKVEESADETTTQGEGQSQEQEKPNFSEDVLKEFVEVENQVKILEEKGSENNYQIKHSRLLELHKNLTASHENVEKLKAQT